jgi:hypothetical protein
MWETGRLFLPAICVLSGHKVRCGLNTGLHAGRLRLEITQCNQRYAPGHRYVESVGGDSVIVYAPEESADGRSTHGNFFDAAYQAIVARPEWARRLDKIHAQGRGLPRLLDEPGRKWRELDSSMSSDALLMNVFCAPGVAEDANVRRMLGIDAAGAPEFGWKARVPLKGGLVDRTEVDMRWGDLLVEAKLTELDFQTRAAAIVEAYRDFDAVFERELLPHVEIREVRRRPATEMPEEFTQEWDDTGALTEHDVQEVAQEFQAGIAERAWRAAPAVAGYAGYQLIRNVLAAYATGSSFCVIHDERRPDLRESWFAVMAAVRSAETRTRLKVLTWQELAAALPGELQEFLEAKYGIVARGR